MDTAITVSIPCDEDGCLLLQCHRCGEFFKVFPDDYEAEDVIELWCPMCGINDENFLPDKVIELIKAKVLNKFAGDLCKEISKLGKIARKQSMIEISLTSSFNAAKERKLLPPVDAYEDVTCSFCGRTEKLKPMLAYIGAYCAFCGERL